MTSVQRILSWIPNCIFWLVFSLILLIFHPLQVIALWISEAAHTRVVNAMIWCLNASLIVVGNRISYHLDLSAIPKDRPLIIASNHQSMFDIPAIGWAFRAYRPKYIAKSGLKKGIPSISYNIRNGGSTTIKLNAPKEAIVAIEAFGKKAYERNYMAVIFPEGARSRNGIPREFKATGLKVLLKNMPNAVVIPVVLHNFWKFERYLCKPVPYGTHKHLHMLTPITNTDNLHEVAVSVGKQINQKLLELNGISNWDSYQ